MNNDYNVDLAKDLKAFIKSKSLSKDGDIYSNYFGNVFLCRVYRFEPAGIDSGLLDKDGKKLANELKRRVIPIGVVLGKGASCTFDIEVGDVVALSDDLVGVSENPAYLDYLIETNAEASRGIEAHAPPQKVSNFLIWRKQYGFIQDKIKEGNDFSQDDFFTFLFPEGFIKAKYNKEKLLEWLGKIS